MRFKGKRIRYYHRNLVFYIFLVPFLLLFVGAFYRINSSEIVTIMEYGIMDIGSHIEFTLDFCLVHFALPLLIGFVPTFTLYKVLSSKSLGLYYLVVRLYHIQNIAQLIVRNNWYEKEAEGGNSKSSRVTFFPKVWYRLKQGRIIITCEIPMTSWQEQFMHLEKVFESSLYCELEEKELKEGYVVYTMLYDMIGFRISIDECKAENGRLRLMYDTWWEYDSLPHMLIAGGTGGGKSYFILSIIESLLRIKSKICICDPKNSDLADLGTVLPDVVYQKEDIVDMVARFYDDMLARSAEIKELPNYVTGKNYAYFDLEPHFLIFDEYVAFIDMLSSKEREEVLKNIKGILMLGRQMGYFIILACQRPDSRYLAEGARDQFGFRVALGKMSEMGYSMMFGETEKGFFFKNIKGRGYVDNGKGLISEFYAPFVHI